MIFAPIVRQPKDSLKCAENSDKVSKVDLKRADCADLSLRRHPSRLSHWGLTHPSTHPRRHKVVIRTTPLGISQDTGILSAGLGRSVGLLIHVDLLRYPLNIRSKNIAGALCLLIDV